MSESANVARSRVLSHTNDPLLWVIDHAHELTEYVFVRIIDCLEFGLTDGEMQTQCAPASLPPRFRNRLALK